MAEKKDPIRSLIDTGRRAGKLTSSEISDAMEENGNVLDVEAMEIWPASSAWCVTYCWRAARSPSVY